jgi:long-chain acyl-CoA synthetase
MVPEADEPDVAAVSIGKHMILDVVKQPFAAIPDCIALKARQDPHHPAVIENDRALDYGAFDNLIGRVAASLQRDGVLAGDAVAICAAASIEYLAVFLGALRAGVTVVPLAPSLKAVELAAMITDAAAQLVFADRPVLEAFRDHSGAGLPKCVGLDGAGPAAFLHWLAPEGTLPKPVAIPPESGFNIIYSSGTTGQPKGIVQSHLMRWGHVQRAASNYGTDAITLLATPLYSNTTLASFFPTIALGGTAVLMAKFDVAQYLSLAERHRVSHTMLVPVQYQRIMAHPEFDCFDLSAFRMKYCTSAPFSPALKADILKRWPGGLVELYGMTEGGGTCILTAHEHPHKLHTVGRPAPGTDMRVIDENGSQLPATGTGEVVGHSTTMMSGYHNNPARTAEAEWYDPNGKRFIRTGDIGRFDEDGFLLLLDRKKDLIISGGFNIYPSDLEATLRQHADVADVAVVGVPSERWGETPMAFIVPRPGCSATSATFLDWANTRLGKTQRLAAVEIVDVLPRSPIGKVLKRELRERFCRTSEQKA